jgi:hypothetical protein
VTPAEIAFRDVTRAAYAAFLNSPPIVAYRITVEERDAVYKVRNVTYEVVFDSRSGLSHRRVPPAGEVVDDYPFLAAPNLDPVGSFTTTVNVDADDMQFATHSVRPLNLPATVTPPPHVDAWTAANDAYVPHFDEADANHTTLLLSATNRYRVKMRGWRLARIRFDPYSMLPVEADLQTDDGGRFDLRYHQINGHQLLRSVVFDHDARFTLTRSTWFGPVSESRGKEHLHIEATYDEYRFPSPAPDARLPAPKPSP